MCVLQFIRFTISTQHGITRINILMRHMIKHVARSVDLITFVVEFNETIGEESVGIETETEDVRMEELA